MSEIHHYLEISTCDFLIKIRNGSILILSTCKGKSTRMKRVNSHLTLLGPMKFSIKFDTAKSGWSIVYIEGSQVIISKKILSFFL